MLNRTAKRALSFLIAAIMVLGAVQWSFGRQEVQGEPTTGSVVFVDTDWQTKGAWNGKYGKDGYILFGYEADTSAIDQTNGANVNKDDFNIVELPSYVSDYEIKSNRTNDFNEGIYVYPGAQTIDGVLQPPIGRTDLTGKVRAVLGGWKPDGETGSMYNYFWSDSRELTFAINDDEEHLFAFYLSGGDNPNIFYAGITFRDLEDNILLKKEQNDIVFGNATDCYVVFKVKGSFKMMFNDTKGINGINGVFFDSVEEALETPAPTATATPSEPTATAAAEKPTPLPSIPPVLSDSVVEYVSTDGGTQGYWNGKYGYDGYVLFGYEADLNAIDQENGSNIQKDSANAVKMPSYVNSYTIQCGKNDGDGVYVYPGDQYYDYVLEQPAGRPDLKDKVRAVLGGWTPDGNTGAQYNYWWSNRNLTFILNDEEEHYFTFYLSGAAGENANIFYAGVTFYDLNNNVLLKKDGNSFDWGEGNNCYVTFKVKGSFRMHYDVTIGLNGIAGVFFGLEGPTPAAVMPYKAKDATLDGALGVNWLGEYGEDGYVLFGYNEPRGSVNKTVPIYSGDKTYKPTYLNNSFADGRFYKLESEDGIVTVKFDPADPAALRNPDDIYGNTNAIVANLGSKSSERTLSFDANDDEEHLFTVYCQNYLDSANPNRVTFKDLNSGEVILSKTIGEMFPQSGNLQWFFMSFVVKGSFSFTYHETDEWYGFSGVFFDRVPGGAVNTAKAKFVGVDKDTKEAWEGLYGSEGHILFGYKSTGAGTAVSGVDSYTYDVAEIPTYIEKFGGKSYTIDGLGIRTVLEDTHGTDDTILLPPQDSGLPKTNAWLGADTGVPSTVTMEFPYDVETYMTLYFRGDFSKSQIQLIDEKGEQILGTSAVGSTSNAWGIGSATYITFLVTGRITVKYSAEELAYGNGISGIFFDVNIDLSGGNKSKVSFAQIDGYTTGAWNGKYGRDGYVLFGYDNTPPDGSWKNNKPHGFENYPMYQGDVFETPAYIDEYVDENDDEHMYKITTTGMTNAIAPGFYNEDNTVLDPPEGTSYEKVWVMGGATIEAPTQTKTYEFLINDDQEHLFSLYCKGVDTYNILFPALTFRDLDGNIIYHVNNARDLLTTSQGDFYWNVYISFYVKGSFTLTISGDGGESLRCGINGVFFDKPDKTFAVYADTNTSIGGDWKNFFGGDGYVLFGYNGLDNSNTTVKESDDVSKPSYLDGYSIQGGVAYNKPTGVSAANVLKRPNGNQGTTIYAARANESRADFTFDTAYDDEDYHLVTVYYASTVNAPASVDVGVIDRNGVVVSSKTIERASMANGIYVSFIVKGNFTLRSTTSASFGPSAVFFDELFAARPQNLKAKFDNEYNIALTWINEGDFDRIIVERSYDGINYKQINVLTEDETQYVDDDIFVNVGEEVFYRLRYAKGTSFGLSSEPASIKMPFLGATTLTLNKNDGFHGVVNENLNISAILTRSNGEPIESQTIKFTIAFDPHDDIVKVIEPIVKTAVTDANGAAPLTGYDFNLTGDFFIKAEFEQNNAEKLNAAKTNEVPFVIDPEPWGKPPVIIMATDGVYAGSSFSLNGYAFFGDDENFAVAMAPSVSSSDSPVIPPAGAIALTVQQLDEEGEFVVLEMPKSADPGVYNVWVRNDKGWSKPYKLNAARSLFMSEYEVFAGLDIQVVGRNFDSSEFGGTENTQVRLVALDGSVVNIPKSSVKDVNPYCVTFTINSEPQGTYYVEVSNDGANWSRVDNALGEDNGKAAAGNSANQSIFRECQTLTILKRNGTMAEVDPLGLGVAWSQNFNWGNRYDVTQNGVVINSMENQREAIQAVVDKAEAAGGGVVYFPNGYYCSSNIKLGQGVVLMGQDKEKTKLYYGGGVAGSFITTKTYVDSSNNSRAASNHGVANFSILLKDEYQRPSKFIDFGADISYYDNRYRSSNEIFIVDMIMDYPTEIATGASPIAVYWCANERIIMNNNFLRGYCGVNTFSIATKYIQMKNNYMEYSTGNIQVMAAYSFVENNHIIANNDAADYGVTHGIFTRDKAYMYNNIVARQGYTNDEMNDGEGIGIEGPNTGYFRGRVLDVNGGGRELTVTSYGVVSTSYHGADPESRNKLFWPRSEFSTLDLVITEGRGLGQKRTITSIDPATMKITIDKPFDIEPDTTSYYSIANVMDQCTAYQNWIDDCTKGILPFGFIYDIVVAENLVADARGIWVWGIAEAKVVQFNYYVNIARNTVINGDRMSNHTGIGLTAGRWHNSTKEGNTEAGFAGTVMYGTNITGNKIIGDGSVTTREGAMEAPPINGIFVVAYGYSNQANGEGERDIVNTLIQDNYLSNLHEGVTLTRLVYGTVIANNEYDTSVKNWLKDDWHGSFDSTDWMRKADETFEINNVQTNLGAYRQTRINVELAPLETAPDNEGVEIRAKLVVGTTGAYGNIPVPGKMLYFFKDDVAIGSGMTNADGEVVIKYESDESEWNTHHLFAVRFSQDDADKLNAAQGYNLFYTNGTMRPVIKTQPQDVMVEYNPSETTPLTVEAETIDGAELSYQWFRVGWKYPAGGVAISGANDKTFNAPKTAYTTTAPYTQREDGSAYYYCIITARKGVDEKRGTFQIKSAAVEVICSSGAYAPTIIKQPEGGTFTKNGVCELKVVAEANDGGTLSYQWYSNTAATVSNATRLTGETNATYNAPTDELGNYFYFVEVTNSVSGLSSRMIASAVVTVHINELVNAVKPVFTLEPQDGFYSAFGTTHPLTAAASSSDGGTVTYQWFKNVINSNEGGTSIQGATSETYEAPIDVAGTIYYYVMATNTNESANGTKTATANSVAARIEVLSGTGVAAPNITKQPESGIYNLDTQCVLSVIATSPDGGTLSYQWYRNGSDSNTGGTAISGAVSALYRVPTGTSGNFHYYVVVTNHNANADGSKTAVSTSDAASITVTNELNAQTPAISSPTGTQTGGVYQNLGGTFELKVMASVTDGGTLTYQWFKTLTSGNTGGEIIPNATSAAYNASIGEIGTVYYYAVVTNTNNNASGNKTAVSTSLTAKVEVVTLAEAIAPFIQTQPQSPSGVVNIGSTFILTVSAISLDGGTLSCQWYRNGSASSTGGEAISGANSNSYTIPSETESDYYYYAVITNTNNNASGNKTASAASNVIRATVAVTVDAAEPKINSWPTSAPGGGISLSSKGYNLTVDAASSDGGAISYRWYSNTTNSNEGGSQIAGATQATYAVPTTSAGTFYYYVVVTNTNNSVNGMKTASLTSEPLTVSVNAVKCVVEKAVTNAPTVKLVLDRSKPIRDITSLINGDENDSGEGEGSWNLRSGPPANANPDDVSYVLIEFDGIYDIVKVDFNNTNLYKAGDVNDSSTFTLIMSASVDGESWTPIYESVTDYQLLRELIFDNSFEAKYIKIDLYSWDAFWGKGAIMFFGSEVQAENAAAPEIVAQPLGGTINVSDTLTLSVTATISDSEKGGAISYQWFSNTSESNSGGTIISGATSLSYVVDPSAVGDYYYYVVITNTNENVTDNKMVHVASNAVKVTANDHINAVIPAIAVQPQGGTSDVNKVFMLSVTASKTDGGVLTYQWYRNDSAANNGGMSIAGATGAEYSVPTDVEGEFYYYVVVTNTNDSLADGANKIAFAVSEPATVKVVLQSVISVTISPPAIEGGFIGANRSINYTFRTFVLTTGEADESVTWEIFGVRNDPAFPQTTIDPITGILSVSLYETAEEITVKATSVFDGTKYGEMQVNILDALEEKDIILEQVENGTVVVSPEAALMGEKVRITMTAKPGYIPNIPIVTFINDDGETENVNVEKVGNDYIFTMPNADVAIASEFISAAVKYTVTFNTDGGGAAEPAEVSGGSTIPRPDASLSKQGYNLGGWYTDSACTQLWDFRTGVSRNMTLYAKWVNARERSFIPKPLLNFSQAQVPNQQSDFDAKNGRNLGYEIKMVTNAKVTGIGYPAYPITREHTIYIVDITNSGMIDSRRYEYSWPSPVFKFSDPKVQGWIVAQVTISPDSPQKDGYYYAELDESVILEIGHTYDVFSSEISDNAYLFLGVGGLYDSKAASLISDRLNWHIDSLPTFYNLWAYIDNPSIEGMDGISVGQTFWFEDLGEDPELSGGIKPPTPTESYTVTFDLNGGASTGGDLTQSVKGGGFAIEPKVPTLESYVFSGWSTTIDGKAENIATYAINKHTTFYAKWLDAKFFSIVRDRKSTRLNSSH